MTSLLFTIRGAVVNALAFSGTNFIFSRLADHGEEERERHDLALKRLHRAGDEWNEDRIKRLDFINKRLREKNKARVYINNADEALLEYYRVFAKQIKPLPPDPQLSDFYHSIICYSGYRHRPYWEQKYVSTRSNCTRTR